MSYDDHINDAPVADSYPRRCYQAPKHTIGVFSVAHHTILRAIYSKMFPTLTEQLAVGIILPQTYHKMNSVYAHRVQVLANEYVLAQNLFPFENNTSDPLNVSHSQNG